MLRASEQLTVKEPLDLRFLPDEGLELDEPLPVDWLQEKLFDTAEGAPAPIRAEKEGAAKLEVSPMGPVHQRPPIRVHGQLLAAISTTCVRCLEPVTESLEAEVDVTLFPEGSPSARANDKKGGDDEEEGLSNAEMDEGVYSGNEVDLPSIIRESLLLEVSMNPVCEDEEACTRRTEAMLAEANRSSEGAIPDRWAALRRLRDSE